MMGPRDTCGQVYLQFENYFATLLDASSTFPRFTSALITLSPFRQGRKSARCRQTELTTKEEAKMNIGLG